MTLAPAAALPPFACALVGAVIAASALAAELPTAATAAQAMVIPPGQETLVTRILTPDALWPAGVTLEGADITGAAVVARYLAEQTAQPLRVQLRHRDAAGPADAKSARFSVVVLSADGWDAGRRTAVVVALSRQLTAHEGQFTWAPASRSASTPAVPPARAGDATRTLGEAVEVARNRELGKARALARQAAAQAELLGAAERAWVMAGVAAVLRAAGDAEAPKLAQAAVDLAMQVTAAEGRLAQARGLLALGRDGDGMETLLALARDGATRKSACLIVDSITDDLVIGEQSAAAVMHLTRWQPVDPNCVGVALAASRAARWSGIGPLALPLLQRAATDHPKNVAVAIHLAHLYKEINGFDDALRIIDNLDFRGAQLDKALVLDITRVYLDVPDNAASLALQRQRSDADPAEPVSAFIVGTILHHTDHWAESNRYLARSEAAFSQEPRQFIYTGMNHYRLGNQAEAETRIERALQLGKSDPDIYYCRAVIRTRKAPDAALADLQTYLKMTAGSRETYAPKEAKVARMIEDLQACRDARDVQECLDLHSNLRTAAYWGPRMAAILALIGLAALFWRRRRRARMAVTVAALTVACLGPAIAWAEPQLVAPQAANAGDLRPTLRAPTSLAAQWTWLSDLDRVQVGVSALLLVASAGFFLPPRR